MPLPVPIIILLVVLLAIALRKLLRLDYPIWLFMLLGALVVLLTGEFPWRQVGHAINWDIMLYLFGVFVLAEALESCGYLAQLTDRLFARASLGIHALLIIVFVLGLSSAILMNDTLAIVGAPIILQLARSHKKLLTPLLLALAYSITLGSSISPIGNPQNLLVSLNGQFASPLWQFFQVLSVPALINLCVVVLFIWVGYRRELALPITSPPVVVIKDRRSAWLCKISLVIMLVLIIAKMLLDTLHAPLSFSFSAIAIVVALPILLFSPRRWAIVRYMDWGTLIFFAAMFVLMQSVWDSGYFQGLLQQAQIPVDTVPMIMTIAVLLSQLISNVPLAALYLPILQHTGAGIAHYLALAAGSTIAGNLLIFGAASNIIIMHNVERRGAKGFSFWQFAKIGLPLTVVNVVVTMVFIKIFSA